MTAVAWFFGGIIAGLALTALGILAAVCWPESKHDSVRPAFYAVAGDKPMLRPDSSAHGAAPSDWSGPIWNPRSRMTAVPYRVTKTELF